MFKEKTAKFINIDISLEEAINTAKKIYFEGKVFVYPTDTIYGFGANPFNERAVENVNKIKGRDLKKMYILLLSDIDTLLQYVEINSEKHLDFLISIWPNPVSVILNLNSKFRKILQMDNAAFRIPHHRFCLKLLSELKMPLISTSVNRSNEPPILEPGIIRDEFSSDVEAIFFSKKRSFLKASTIITLVDSKPGLIREGKIKYNDLLKKFG
ncbi:MAG: L-threonylcarbamoyladenylate synthase [Ignavibacteriaceae bacterium]